MWSGVINMEREPKDDVEGKKALPKEGDGSKKKDDKAASQSK